MKACAVIVCLFVSAVPGAQAAAVSPISKVFEMLAGLQAKIIKEGEDAQKTYDSFTEWCEDRSKNVGFEIKTGKSEKADLEAAIEKSDSTISSLSTKIEELAAAISKDEADLSAATKIREEEAADFAAEEKESTEVIGMLERAVAVLERELSKGGAAMLQLKSAGNIVQALGALVQGSVLSSADGDRLTALLQSQDSDDSAYTTADVGAPAAAVYESKSSGIVGTIQDLLDKATAQLEKARKAEDSSLHNYQMLKQSLSDEIEFTKKDLADAKTGQAAAAEAKATAEGDLAVTTKDLDEDVATLKTLHQDCMNGAADFETETKSRAEELQALATAKKVLKEALALNQVSFLQTEKRSTLSTRADLAKFEAVRYLRDLAKKENSVGLAQLASRMASVIRFSASSGADPFAKVKSLITDMISKLEKEGQGEASHKAYCDKETSEAIAKRDEKKALVSKLSTKIDSMSAKSTKLKEEVATLQKELAQMASSKGEMDKIRSEEKALYGKNKAEQTTGLNGVQKALQVLKDYYAKAAKGHAAASDSAGGIVSLLEIVESDFTKSLAEMEVVEQQAVAEYEKVSKEIEMSTAMKSQDVKYKTKEAASLDKSVSETSSDREGSQTELDAVMEYLEKLNKMCVAKAEPYAEKVARREKEIAGLKEALKILDGEAVLIQKSSRRTLRGHA